MGYNIKLSEPYLSISLRIPLKMLEKITELVEKKVGRDRSDTIRNMIVDGIWLYENKKTLCDPEKMKKNIEEYNKRLEEKNSSAWLAQLSGPRLEGVMMGIELERENRAKNQ